MNDDLDLKQLAIRHLEGPRVVMRPDASGEILDVYLDELKLAGMDFSEIEDRLINYIMRGQSKDRPLHETIWPAHKEKINEILTGRVPNLMIIDEWHDLPSGILYQRLDRPEPDVPDWKHPIPPQVKGASPGPSERKRAALRAKRKKRSR